MDAEVEQLAEERTQWALERTLLANERTFSAWLRTGLAAVVAGLGIAHFLDLGTLQLMADAIGAILILTGGGIYFIAYWRYRGAHRKLEQEGMTVIPIWLPSVLIAALLLSAGLAFSLLFLR
jgi:putative membrane protein